MSVFAQLRSALANTLAGLRGSPLTSTIAAATIGVCLVLAGAFAVLVANMEAILERFGEELHVVAYLAPDLPPHQVDALMERALAQPGVDSVTHVSAEEAAERFRRTQPERAVLLDGLEANPLPASIELQLAPAQRSSEAVRAVSEMLAGLDGVTEIGSGNEWIEGYAQAVALIRGVGLAIGAVLALATLLIVANTIRLSIYARRDEIDILRLVGASRSYVAAPFLLEGLLEGIVGGLLGLASLWAGWSGLAPLLGGGLTLLIGDNEPRFLSAAASAWIVGAGALLGVLGSAAALLQTRQGR
ncbi:MAG: ABC transporter permease [Deltaproteobacteria bacterium]|nr:ABC transporter permease [Deltaproteobacteria bacterium]